MTSLDQSVSDATTIDPSSGTADAAGPSGEAAAVVEQETAANLMAGLGSRLRAAYEAGADLAGLAAACRQPVVAVRRLLAEAGVDPAGVRAAAESAGPIEARQLRRLRRPTPSRRLRRIHAAEQWEPEAGPADRGPGSSPEPIAAAPEVGTPMGILIGVSTGCAEPSPQSRAEPSRRVAARLVRAGRGTSLVVMPQWRSAIAVSVPTEQLMASTGLEFAELHAASLSVVINPDALHDRELRLRDWRSEPQPCQAGRPFGRWPSSTGG